MQRMMISRILRWGVVAAGVFFLNSCVSTSTSTVAPLIVKSEGPYVIGDRGPGGGWIIHDKGSDTDGWRYLEAAPEDQTPRGWSHKGLVPWGCRKKSIPGARYTGLGTGMRNTKAILAQCDETATAACLCADYRGGDKEDWFLPALDELNAIYMHLYKKGLGGMSLGEYWSSSETTKGYAWNLNFTNGKQLYSNKWPKYRVRCVRAFSDTPVAKPGQLSPVPVEAPPEPAPVQELPMPKGRVLD
jgi:hypothetical protein